MRSIKNSFFYLIVIGVSSALMYWIILKGKMLEVGQNIVANQKENGHWNDLITSMSYNLKNPLAIILAQIVTIILVARFFGWVCRRIGQPTVIGEMIAGIVLGPSLIGLYFPKFSALLFPKIR